MSRLDLLVGPNGAGKSTLFFAAIAPDRPGLPFVNADLIAAQRFGDEAMLRSREAAEIAARTRSALIEARIDFATETVFSHPSKVDLVDEAVAAGYDVALHVVMIPLELSAPRVASRVRSGGHDVPTAKLTDRYPRLWPLVAQAVPRCAEATFYDNASVNATPVVATFRHGVRTFDPTWPDWAPEVLRSL